MLLNTSLTVLIFIHVNTYSSSYVLAILVVTDELILFSGHVDILIHLRL